MRTARPLVTCCKMAECGPSATSGVISTPRLIGPGASSRMSGLALLQPFRAHAEQPGVFGNRWEQPAALPFELDAQHVDDVAARQDVVELVRHLDAQLRRWSAGTSVGGPQTITLAPSLSKPWMLLRATRLWAMSPTRPTVNPSMRPFVAADGEDVEQTLRRVFVGPVAGVDDAAVEVLGQQMRGAGVVCRTTMTSTPIASMFLAVSMNVSPLLRLELLGVKSSVSAPRRRRPG